MYDHTELLRRLLPRALVVDGGLLSTDSLTRGDIISLCMLAVYLLGFLVAAAGIFLTYRQIKQNNRLNRATFLKEFYTTMFTDADIRKVWYMVEYNRFAYEGDEKRRDPNFHETELEKATDRLLTFVDLLCSLHARGVITDEEMEFFKYEIGQMYTNEDLDRYLRHVKASYEDVGLAPYKSYFQYCEKNFKGRPFRLREPDVPPVRPDESYFVLPVERTKNIHVWLR